MLTLTPMYATIGVTVRAATTGKRRRIVGISPRVLALARSDRGGFHLCEG
jgi:hypothetical protein